MSSSIYERNNEVRYSSSNSITVVVNRYPPMSSLYRYTQDVMTALPTPAILINLLYDREGWNKEHVGEDFQPRLKRFSLFNGYTMNLSFRDATILIRKLSRKYSQVIVYYTNQFAGLFQKIGNINIISVHDSPYNTNISTRLQRYYTRWLYSRISKEEHIMVQTETLAKDLKNFGFTGKISVIPLSYSPVFKPLNITKEDLRKNLGLPMDKKIVLSVSTTERRKNLLEVKRTMDLLGEDFKLVRVGASMPNSITFENIGDNKLNEIYNASDVLLFPSLYEGFGFPIVEAFASGLPVVTSRIPTIEEISGNAAVLVNPLVSEEIVQGVKLAIDSSTSLINSGLKRANNFSFEIFSQRITEYYRNLGI